VDGKLLVAHDRRQVQTGTDLQALYLDPLRECVKHNVGRVYANGPEFTLLIDLKSDWRRDLPGAADRAEGVCGYALHIFQVMRKPRTRSPLSITGTPLARDCSPGRQFAMPLFDGGLAELDLKRIGEPYSLDQRQLEC